MFGRNQHKSVKQLSLNEKINLKFKNRKKREIRDPELSLIN